MKGFGESQRLSHFPIYRVLYSPSKFGIIKPWTNIQSLRRFFFGIRQTSKWIYRKIQYREKVFLVFRCFPRLSRKKVLCYLTQFGIKKSWTNIQPLRRFRFGLRETSKRIYRKLQYREKVFGEFQGFRPFARKKVLFLLTKFAIIKPWTNIQSLRRFDLRFWQPSKQIYRKL